MPAHGEKGSDSRAHEAVGAVLQRQPANSDEGDAQRLRLNDVLLHGGFEEPAIRIGVFKGMNVDGLAVGRHPVRAG